MGIGTVRAADPTDESAGCVDAVGPGYVDAADSVGAVNVTDATDTVVSSSAASAPSLHSNVAQVVGRFAPSPTGRMHLGNILASLLAWLSVRSQGGKLVLRIEDLDDRARSGPWDALLMDDLRWLGLDWDEGPYYQTDRIDLYADAVRRLDDMGLVYPCFCTRAELHAASAPHASDGTPVYAGTCRGLTAAEVVARSKARPPALRLKVPPVQGIASSRGPFESFASESKHSKTELTDFGNSMPRELTFGDCSERGTRGAAASRGAAGGDAGVMHFEDRTYGPQREVLAEECGDFLVRRSDGVYAYQLAVVVDDADMGVNEVVRGCDLLGSTARQMYLQDLLGYAHPSYAHVPLLVAPDGRRLSKRDRDCDMGVLREHFGTPGALLGRLAYVAGLVSSPEPRTADQLADGFSWSAVCEHRDNIAVEECFFA
ncbi:glutamyl-queuosine tRNA(Asp) synthetase [Collinsella stercoris DSM 13279]|uniref:Glutamyl-Q tRNA(Asp) synthetase n=2 Tax=Collinsella TaxID=102106 RepID=B6GAI7_9ACTN|nr:glutamyl-queuosine tRNA(Asp) synthetase [Collinsella stercoris DSM 13279]UEA45466.1 tRNA glutamyl-Q(34) synthetase GluQRS [Collinsella stercoris DSM 13279]